MDNLLDHSKLSPIELAKHLMTFKSLAKSKDAFETLKKILISGEKLERVNQIISGLEQESEFAILCKLMDTCDSISKIDQSPIIQNDEIAPDFLVSFSPGCTVTGKTKKDIKVKFNCFVEVKSSKKKVFKISKKDFIKRKTFVNRYGIPLIFAVRFTILESHGFWVLVDSNDLKKQNYKITLSDFIGNLNHVLFDDYSLISHPQLHIAHYYNSKSTKSGVRHKNYGRLFKTVILIPDKKPIELEHDKEVLINAVLESFNFKEVEVKRDDSITCSIVSVEPQIRFLSDILFKINHLALDLDGNVDFDATNVIAKLDNKEAPPILVTREMVVWAINRLNQKETVLFLGGIGEPKEQEKQLRSLNIVKC